MKTCRGVAGIAVTLFTSAVDGGEWPASQPSRFTPTGKSPITHWIGGWVGLRATRNQTPALRAILAPNRVLDEENTF